MIVRDGIETIERSIESARGLIDCWVILDTGSTDGTQAKIRELLAGVPGELHERAAPSDGKPTALGPARNEALELARKTLGAEDYILLTAARQYVVIQDSRFKIQDAIAGGADCYEAEVRDCGLSYLDNFLLRAGVNWRFMGRAHEYLWSAEPTRTARLEGICRVRPPKDAERTLAGLRRDREILELQVKEEPENARARFYLAQSYRDLGVPEMALRSYNKRAGMGGFEEEAWWAQYEAAMLMERMGKSPEAVLFAYQMAYERRPTRAEPLYQAARFCREKGWNHAAILYASRGQELARPRDERLFVDDGIYLWKLLDEFAISGYWSGKYRAAVAANERLLEVAPESERGRIQANLTFCAAALKKGI